MRGHASLGLFVRACLEHRVANGRNFGIALFRARSRMNSCPLFQDLSARWMGRCGQPEQGLFVRQDVTPHLLARRPTLPKRVEEIVLNLKRQSDVQTVFVPHVHTFLRGSCAHRPPWQLKRPKGRKF